MFNANFVVEVKCEGKILTDYYGKVYLPFDSEYSLVFRNLDTRRAVVRVHIDGDDVLYGKQLICQGNSIF